MSGLSTVAPSASSGPEIQELRARLPREVYQVPCLECHFAGILPPMQETEISWCTGRQCPALGDRPRGSWIREEQLWLIFCPVQMCWPVWEVVSPIFILHLPFLLPPLRAVPVSAFLSSLSPVFLCSLLNGPSLQTDMPFPLPCITHCSCAPPLPFSGFCLTYLDCKLPGVLLLSKYLVGLAFRLVL